MGRVRAMEGELRTGRRDDLLLLGPRKLTENGLSDRGWRLDGQGVHEHVRGGRHGGQLARDSEQPRHKAERRGLYTQLQSRRCNDHISPIAAKRGQWRMKTPRGCFFSAVEGDGEVKLREVNLQNSSGKLFWPRSRGPQRSDSTAFCPNHRPYVIAPHVWRL